MLYTTFVGDTWCILYLYVIVKLMYKCVFTGAVVLGVLFALVVLLLAVFIGAFTVLFCHHREVRFQHYKYVA